ncbi:hypothetical protein OUZ56_026304 [Daphnia magna]|uniref:Uncharacterized protein n=1 Tax=Daphnia magna TaxID=35525 RepID=A0ABQ9ZLG0_9CRUS|nr:hypothetical protein OUZ56_026304 [Daphnia magna]
MLPESINFLTRVPGKNELLFKIKWKECCVEESSNLLIALGLPQWFSQEKNDTWRFCVDYRKLNAVTVKDSFPLPPKFNKVIKTINGKLPRGWSISSDELLVAYRESTVSVVAMENSFRLFIHVPIFYHAQQYKLFQIINLPGATDNGTHGVLFGNLPDYLAVSVDLETFLELSKDDVQDCSKIGNRTLSASSAPVSAIEPLESPKQ